MLSSGGRGRAGGSERRGQKTGPPSRKSAIGGAIKRAASIPTIGRNRPRDRADGRPRTALGASPSPATRQRAILLDGPSTNMGSPSMNMGSPSTTMGSPSMNMGSPSTTMGSPSMNMGSPSTTMGSATTNMGSPSTSLGRRQSSVGGRQCRGPNIEAAGPHSSGGPARPARSRPATRSVQPAAARTAAPHSGQTSRPVAS
jgi:hypothetical protein